MTIPHNEIVEGLYVISSKSPAFILNDNSEMSIALVLKEGILIPGFDAWFDIKDITFLAGPFTPESIMEMSTWEETAVELALEIDYLEAECRKYKKALKDVLDEE